jgi:Putative beta barrel porin-7 (BBP7)
MMERSIRPFIIAFIVITLFCAATSAALAGEPSLKPVAFLSDLSAAEDATLTPEPELAIEPKSEQELVEFTPAVGQCSVGKGWGAYDRCGNRLPLLCEIEEPSILTCMPKSCNCCTGCMVGPQGSHWIRAEYLLMWSRGAKVPPLATTSTNGGTGIIGEPGTEILYGSMRSDMGSRSNVRISGGFWFDECRSEGLQFDFFSLGKADDSVCFPTSSSQIVSRPFVDAKTGLNSIEIVNNGSEGEFCSRNSEYFHSFGIDFLINCVCCECPQDFCMPVYCEDGCGESCGESCGETCNINYPSRAEIFFGKLWNRYRPDSYRTDMLIGWRSHRLDERIDMHEVVTVYDHPPIMDGTVFDITDSFRTQSEFHGCELGFINKSYWNNCWSLDLTAKVGIGNQNQVCSIDGSTTVTVPVEPPEIDVREQGLMAQPSNMGHHSRNMFVAIPEFAIELGYQCRENVWLTFGYRVIYWSNTLRATEQIDTSLNPDWLESPMPTSVDPSRPSYDFVSSDYWVQGITLGLECRF